MYEYLTQQIAIVKGIMVKRAKANAKCFIEDDLFELKKRGVVLEYDEEDAENHQYDLGRLKTLEEVKEFLIKNNKKQ